MSGAARKVSGKAFTERRKKGGMEEKKKKEKEETPTPQPCSKLVQCSEPVFCVWAGNKQNGGT